MPHMPCFRRSSLSYEQVEQLAGWHDPSGSAQRSPEDPEALGDPVNHHDHPQRSSRLGSGPHSADRILTGRGEDRGWRRAPPAAAAVADITVPLGLRSQPPPQTACSSSRSCARAWSPEPRQRTQRRASDTGRSLDTWDAVHDKDRNANRTPESEPTFRLLVRTRRGSRDPFSRPAAFMRDHRYDQGVSIETFRTCSVTAPHGHEDHLCGRDAKGPARCGRPTWILVR